MSDEVAKDIDKIKKRRKKRHAKKNRTTLIIILILIVSVSCTVYINMTNPLLKGIFSGFGISHGEDVVEFEKTEKFALADFDGNAVISRNNTIFCVNDNMNVLWTVEQTNPMPVVKTCEDYALTYSFDVPDVMLIKDGKGKVLTTDGNYVVAASVNENGYCALITREKGYKAQVLVYSPDGDVVFKWHSADNYVVDAKVSPDNKCLAVATADFSTDIASGGLMFFNFAQEKPFAGSILENNMIMELKYFGRDSLLVVGDIGTAVFSGSGEKKHEYLYGGKKLTNYDIGTEDNLVLSLTEGDSVLTDSDVVFLNKNLKEKGDYIIKGVVLCMNSVNGKTLVAANRQLVVLSKNGKELTSLNLNKDIKGAVLFDDGDKALIASGSTAQVVELD